MPNWSTNIIRAEGTAADLREFLERVRGPDGVLDFNMIIPLPERLRRSTFVELLPHLSRVTGHA